MHQLQIERFCFLGQYTYYMYLYILPIFIKDRKKLRSIIMRTKQNAANLISFPTFPSPLPFLFFHFPSSSLSLLFPLCLPFPFSFLSLSFLPLPFFPLPFPSPLYSSLSPTFFPNILILFPPQGGEAKSFPFGRKRVL